MPTLLHVEVSPLKDNSVSREVSAEFITSWKAAHPAGTVVIRDLSANPVPHLDAETILAGYTPEGDRPATMAAKHDARIELVEEVLAADEIVISTPMWNWSLPSVLKAYFDQLIVPGRLDASGAQGLAGKRITFIVAQGGSYAEGSPREGWDYLTGYLDHVATVLGSTDVNLVLAELTLAGVAPGMDDLVPMKQASIAAAKKLASERAAA